MNVRMYIKNFFSLLKWSLQKPTKVNVISLTPTELLRGRIALITGGTSGIGRAIAVAFLKAGAKVVITGRNREKLATAIESIYSECGIKCDGIVMDISDIPTLENKFDEVLSLDGIGSVDILVNNAGINGGDFSSCDENEYDKVLETNLKGSIFLTRFVSSHMIKKRIKGNILNIASSSSLRPATTAYALSKWGVKGWTIGLAKTLIDNNIVVNGIAPGPTATPMLLSEGSNDLSLPNNPSKRFIMPEEIANLAVFMTSDLGRMIVGDIVYMTGGAGTITVDDISY